MASVPAAPPWQALSRGTWCRKREGGVHSIYLTLDSHRRCCWRVTVGSVWLKGQIPQTHPLSDGWASKMWSRSSTGTVLANSVGREGVWHDTALVNLDSTVLSTAARHMLPRGLQTNAQAGQRRKSESRLVAAKSWKEEGSGKRHFSGGQ